jgi:hypothetical protein
MQSIGKIAIDVGANLSGLSIGMDESLSLLDRWTDHAEGKAKSISSFLTEGLANGPMNLADQAATVMGGLANSIDALVEGPLSALPQGVKNGFTQFGLFNEKVADTIGLIGDVHDGFQPLMTMFPALGRLGEKATKTIGSGLMKFVKHPAVLVAGAVVGLGVAFLKNLDPAARLLTNIGNRFVDAYNSSLPFRKVVETITFAFNSAYEGAKAFFNFTGLGIKTVSQIASAAKNGQFGLIDDHIRNAKLQGLKIGKEYETGIAEAISSSSKRLVEGMEPITFEQVRNSDFFKSAEQLKSKVGSFMSDVFGGETQSNDKALEEMSDAWQKAMMKGGEGTSEAKTKIEELKAEMSRLSALWKDQFLNNNSEGAEQTIKDLEEIKTQLREVEEYGEQVQAMLNKGLRPKIDAPEQISSLPIGNVQFDGNLITGYLDRLDDLSHKLREVDNIKVFEGIKEEMRRLISMAEQMGAVVPENIKKMAEAADETEQAVGDVGQAMSFYDSGTSLFENIITGADAENIARINDELKEQRRILGDTSMSKEAREEAKLRIEILEKEMQAEKARGNIIIQTTATLLDTAQQIIRAKLAEAIANAIATESKKGIAGLVTAGIAIAGVTALFKSKVPRLASGGLLRRRTLFEGGEYPGAADNPEVVEPLNSLTGRIQKALFPKMKDMIKGGLAVGQNFMDKGRAAIEKNFIPQATMSPAPVIIGGELSTMLRGQDLYATVRLTHETEVRTTGYNPFMNG